MISLDDVYKTFDEWIYFSDKKRIDVVLAVALSHKYKNKIPLWMFIVGASSAGKSTQLDALINNRWSYSVESITSKTFASAYKKSDDLAPKVDGKVVIIRDMAEIIKSNPNERSAIWAMFRNLYDGHSSRHTGAGNHKSYDNLRITLLAGATDAIDSQIALHSELGTRELMFRVSGSNSNVNDIDDIKMRSVLNDVCVNFIDSCDVVWDNSCRDVLFDLAKFIAFMRSPVSVDAYSGEIIDDVVSESPQRVAKQLYVLFSSLMSLDSNYTSSQALSICRKVAFDSSDKLRMRVIMYFIQNKNKSMSTNFIAHALGLNRKTVITQLFALRSLGVLDSFMDDFSDIKNYIMYNWKLIDHPILEVFEKQKVLNV